jgi:hypothetical protein
MIGLPPLKRGELEKVMANRIKKGPKGQVCPRPKEGWAICQYPHQEEYSTS